MNIEIEWQEPILIAKGGRIIRDHADDFPEVEKFAGVYFFSRKWGTKCQPFYIGKGDNIHRRLKEHLNSRKIADALRGYLDGNEYIKTGERKFHFGYVFPKTNQNVRNCISICEKYLIQTSYNDLRHDLLNIRLRNRKFHEIYFTGAKSGRGPFGDLNYTLAGN